MGKINIRNITKDTGAQTVTNSDETKIKDVAVDTSHRDYIPPALMENNKIFGIPKLWFWGGVAVIGFFVIRKMMKK